MVKHFLNPDRIGQIYDRVYLNPVNQNRSMVADRIIHHLLRDLHEGGRFVDLGGGTGDTIERIRNKLPNSQTQFILVEPNESMASVANHKADEIYLQTAEEFVASNRQVIDRVLLQEVVHLVDQLEDFFGRLHKQMSREGKILILTRDHQNPPFPFGKHAIHIWREISTPVDVIVDAMEKAGFEVSIRKELFPVIVNKEVWFEFIGTHRVLTNLSMLNEQEAQKDLEEIKARYANEYQVKFIDEQIFITAKKSN